MPYTPREIQEKRYELVKAIVTSQLANPGVQLISITNLVRESLKLADLILKELGIADTTSHL